MITIGLFARLEAKPGKEVELKSFLQRTLTLAEAEITTPLWLSLQLGPTTFAIFDAFNDAAGLQAHATGKIAAALAASAADLLAGAPTVEQFEIIGAKLA